MRSWIAGAAVVLTLGAPLSLQARACDPNALLAGCAASAPPNATFLDLMAESAWARDGGEPLSPLAADAQDLRARPPAALTQPAVYTGVAAVLTPAIDTPLASRSAPGWLALPAVGPAPGFAWVLAFGFLGLIVLRRTRAARSY
jgi:hypothetical protein